jgi:hypothetical protein
MPYLGALRPESARRSHGRAGTRTQALTRRPAESVSTLGNRRDEPPTTQPIRIGAREDGKITSIGHEN